MSTADELERLPMPMGYFRLLLRCFGDTLERRAAILAGTDVSEAALADPAADISLFQQLRQFDNLKALLGEGWTLTAPHLWQIANSGTVGVAALTAPTLGRALEMLAKYWRTRGPQARNRLRRFPSEAHLEFPRTVVFSELQDRVVTQMRFFALRSLAEAVLGRPPRKARYEFSCSEPAYSERIRRALGGIVTWGAEQSLFVMPADHLDDPSPLSAPALHGRAVEELDRALRQLATPSELRARVDRLLHTMPDGKLDAATAARALGVSHRTLARRLAETGHNYRALVDGEQKLRAGRLLRSGGPSHAEIAHRLGYADPTSFGRACRRWFPVQAI
jgi:AraC-like DNA-binding protein